MIYPKFIEKNDIIGVTAPSDGIVEKNKVFRLECAVKNFEMFGFRVLETSNVRSSVKGRSSSSVVQAEELKSLFLNCDVSLIMCAGGGEFLLEMLSCFDFSCVLNNLKWIQGYSDPTGLLFVITTNLDVATIYGDNVKSFGMKPLHMSLINNLEMLKGNLLVQESFDKYESERVDSVVGDEAYNLTCDVCWENLFDEEKLEISGRIIGGCIDVISEIFGTRFDKTKEFIEKYKEDGIIWYFDNCELSSESLIRTLWKFKDNGWFKYCKGIVFGRSMIEVSRYDISFKEAIIYSLGELGIPIIINVDIGHLPPRMTIINGGIAKIVSMGGKGRISFELR